MNDYKQELINMGVDLTVATKIEGIELDQTDQLVIEVDKARVKHRDIEFHVRIFRELERSNVNMKNKIIFLFNEYDDDPRELYEVPEVRKWLTRLIKSKPNILYFLNEEAGTLRLVLSCIFECQVVSSTADLRWTVIKPQPEWMSSILDTVLAYSLQRSGCVEEIVEVRQRILRNLGIEI